ncbi:hypothetical protein Q3G72_028155 [Acer saccharum]|nr:hypothetical protein Q3G72_028155 [Acer saccharum]
MPPPTSFQNPSTSFQNLTSLNSAKDNGASSSNHFEIDQESIQQSDKEAIQQSHEEANEDYSASSSDHSE